MTSPLNGLQSKYTSLEDIPEIHARVSRTFDSGVTLPLSYRRRQLLQLARLLRDNTPMLEDALHSDLRKPKLEIGVTEIGYAISMTVKAAQNLEQWAKPEKPVVEEWRSNWDITVYKVPKGPSLSIVPWNYPVILTVNPLIGAIAAGCPCVVKMSELAPATAFALAELFPKYLDPEAYIIVTGDIPQAIKLLDLRWSHIFFTGSTRIGRMVATAAAKYVTPCTLELGSKSPVFIDEDYDDLFLAAKRILYGKGNNAGQLCFSPDYVLVLRKRLAEITSAFQNAHAALWPKSQLDPNTEWSKIINAAHFIRLRNLLETTRGEVILGGAHDEKEMKISMTVVKVQADDPLITSGETFGPILSLVPIDNLAEGIAIVNKQPIPLVVYAFTNSEAFKERLLCTTRSGNLVLNDTVGQIGVYEVPFGGQGDSGYGNYFGKYTFDTFTQCRSYVNIPAAAEPFLAARYPPYSEEGCKALCAGMDLEIPEV